MAADWGVAMRPFEPNGAIVWPALGIALAALLRWGLGMWPAIGAAAFCAELGSGIPPSAALGSALGQLTGPLAAAWALRRLGFRHSLERPQDLALYGGVGIAAAALIVTANAAWWAPLDGLAPAEPGLAAMLRGWAATSMAALLVGVPLLTLSRASLARAFGAQRWPASLAL